MWILQTLIWWFYILQVMISNNKAIDAMANDLKLFLNDNAETFAAWLKNVLDKLKLVTKSAAAKAGKYVPRTKLMAN